MDTQNRGIELALFLTLPATVAFVFASEPIIRGLFQHGHFTAIDSVRCSWALSAFSLGLPSYVLVKVLTPGFYARHDTKTPVRYAIQSVGVNLVGNLILIPVLGRFGYGHVGPPLATALASTVNVWMLYRTLRKRGHFEADTQLQAPRAAARVAVADDGRCAVLRLRRLIDPYLTGSILRRAARPRRRWSAAAWPSTALACFLTGAFVLDDVKLLIKRRAARSMTKSAHQTRRFRHPADRRPSPRQFARRDPALGADAGRGRVPVLPRRPPRADRRRRSRTSCARTSARWRPR